MSVVTNSSSLPIFANLHVTFENKLLDKTKKQAACLTHIWHFYDQTKPIKSLVSRVELWQIKNTPALVNIFYQQTSCEKIKQSFCHMKASYFHHHEKNWYKLQLTEIQDIYDFLTLFNFHSTGQQNKFLSSKL